MGAHIGLRPGYSDNAGVVSNQVDRRARWRVLLPVKGEGQVLPVQSRLLWRDPAGAACGDHLVVCRRRAAQRHIGGADGEADALPRARAGKTAAGGGHGQIVAADRLAAAKGRAADGNCRVRRAVILFFRAEAGDGDGFRRDGHGHFGGGGVAVVTAALNLVPHLITSGIRAFGDSVGVFAVLGQSVFHGRAFTVGTSGIDKFLLRAGIGQPGFRGGRVNVRRNPRYCQRTVRIGDRVVARHIVIAVFDRRRAGGYGSAGGHVGGAACGQCDCRNAVAADKGAAGNGHLIRSCGNRPVQLHALICSRDCDRPLRDIRRHAVRRAVAVVGVAHGLIPYIIGSGVGSCRDGCGIRLCCFGCVAEGVLHLTACGRSCCHKFLRLSVIGQRLSRRRGHGGRGLGNGHGHILTREFIVIVAGVLHLYGVVARCGGSGYLVAPGRAAVRAVLHAGVAGGQRSRRGDKREGAASVNHVVAGLGRGLLRFRDRAGSGSRSLADGRGQYLFGESVVVLVALYLIIYGVISRIGALRQTVAEGLAVQRIDYGAGRGHTGGDERLRFPAVDQVRDGRGSRGHGDVGLVYGQLHLALCRVVARVCRRKDDSIFRRLAVRDIRYDFRILPGEGTHYHRVSQLGLAAGQEAVSQLLTVGNLSCGGSGGNDR